MTITDEMVERAAKAIALNWFVDTRTSPFVTKLEWDRCTEDEQSYFLHVARAALEAALTAGRRSR